MPFQYHMLFEQANYDTDTPERFHTVFAKKGLLPYLIQWTEKDVFYYAMPHKRKLFKALRKTLTDLYEPKELCECEN